MRARTAILGLIGLGLMATTGAARADVDASGILLCALQEAVDCDAAGECSAGPPGDVNLPALVRFDFGKKTLSILDDQRRDQTTELRSVEDRAGHIVIQGFEARAFSVQIVKASGALTAAVADEGFGFLVFGSCARP